MPDESLKRLGMRRDHGSIDRGNDDAGVGYRSSITAIPSQDTRDLGTDLFGVCDGTNDVRANISLQVPSAHGKDQEHVSCAEMAYLQPCGVGGLPAFVIGTRRKLADVVAGGISLDSGNFTEIVDGVTGVTGTASYSDQEKPALRSRRSMIVLASSR